MLFSLVKKIDSVIGLPVVDAHCDVPCGIYDPTTAQIAALTVLRFLKQAAELGDSREDHAKFARLVLMKEEHAEKVKHEIRIIWGDFIKGDTYDNDKEFTDLTHDIMLAGSACKQSMKVENGEKLVELLNKFAEKFWAAKKVKTYRAVCPYEPKVETVYPKLD